MTTPAQDEAIASATSGLFARRASGQWFVNGFTVLAFAAIAYANWPTSARQIEKRAAAYVEAMNRGDLEAAAGYVLPAARPAWRAATRSKAAHEFDSLQVDEKGQSASVVFVDSKSRASTATTWLRVDKGWFCDCGSSPV